MNYIKTVVLPKSDEKAKAREVFENTVNTSSQLKDWLSYIHFEEERGELKRVCHLFERAMGSHLELQNSYPLWQSYSEFIQEKLKNVTTMRAKFEQRLSNSRLMAVKDKIEIFLEQAMFEEIQSNTMRARKLFEQLDEEIAPGLVKATINRINFEKRQGNNEKARELYFNAF